MRGSFYYLVSPQSEPPTQWKWGVGDQEPQQWVWGVLLCVVI